ncbi:MAG: riboflavin synthase [Patescibacteria group bacterium]|nr:riboflavin synthase [Patescibacteria group bacterium]
MFTGIIKSVGKVENTGNPLLLKHDLDVSAGDSISVNGVCLTVNDEGAFDLMEETLSCTNLGDLQAGDMVNLEPALTLKDGLDGHLVAGHVDFAAEVLKAGDVLRISFPSDYGKFLALKGSVSVNGTSLTISGLSEEFFEVSLVDFTLKNTNLGDLKQGNKVNIEVDLIARYIQRMIEA